jgi:hypothetical protein
LTRPYVGITGFVSRAQVEAVLKGVTGLGWPKTHLLMIGVLVSPKSLRREPLKPYWANMYPPPERLADIFAPDPRALNLIHYNSKEPNLAGQLSGLADVPNLQGFQLNIVWPSAADIKDFRRLWPDLMLVLQVSKKSFDQLASNSRRGFSPKSEHDRQALRQKLAEYVGLVEYVLLDCSGGLGVELDRQMMLQVVNELKDAFGDKLVLGVAGGLEAESIPRLRSIISIYPGLFWDAQGRMQSDNQLDLEKCMAFLRASAGLFAGGTASD